MAKQQHHQPTLTSVKTGRNHRPKLTPKGNEVAHGTDKWDK